MTQMIWFQSAQICAICGHVPSLLLSVFICVHLWRAFEKKPPRKATGHPTAHDRYCLRLLPFGPDLVHSQPLHRTRPPSTAASSMKGEKWGRSGRPVQASRPSLHFSLFIFHFSFAGPAVVAVRG